MTTRQWLEVGIVGALVAAAGVVYLAATPRGPETPSDQPPGPSLRASGAQRPPTAPDAPIAMPARVDDARTAAAADPRLQPLVDAFARAAQRSHHDDADEARPIDEAEATGGTGSDKVWKVDRDGIHGAIKESLPLIKECYESWLSLNPELGGKIVATFIIGAPEKEAPTARVTAVKVADGSLGNNFLEGCVLSVFSDLRFEVPTGGEIRVNYPLIFKADSGNDAEAH